MRVLILTVDAGGGHRSVARALSAGLSEVGGTSCDVRVVDFLADYAPFPLSRGSELYSFLMRYPLLWDVFYASTNHRSGRTLNAPAVGLAMEAGMARLVREHDPDVIVGTHPMAAPALNALFSLTGRTRPYYTVVTDYGALHTWWAYPFGELWFTPCAEVSEHLQRSGIPRERLVNSGYPVHPRFARPAAPKAELRQRLGLEPERFTALLVGGAEGVGPIEQVAADLAEHPAPWQLIVVAGRNKGLHERLLARQASFRIPVRVEGLVDDMPLRMHAADLLLTKAGGSTMSEGLACGLPVLLTSALPGQEEENADYFGRLGVARRLLDPAEARPAVAELACPDSSRLQEMHARLQGAANPLAAIDVARQILERGPRAQAVPLAPFFDMRWRRQLGRHYINLRQWLE
jgi:1,2-diacylglycerol 3-beta-galactosyltransferase